MSHLEISVIRPTSSFFLYPPAHLSSKSRLFSFHYFISIAHHLIISRSHSLFWTPLSSHHFIPSAPHHYRFIALLLHQLTILSSHHFIATTLHHLITLSPHQLTIPPLCRLTTSSPHHFITTPLPRNTTSSPHHFTTLLYLYFITSPLHHLTTVSPHLFISLLLHHLTTSHHITNHHHINSARFHFIISPFHPLTFLWLFHRNIAVRMFEINIGDLWDRDISSNNHFCLKRRMDLSQCCGSGMFISDPGSQIHGQKGTGSRIPSPDPQQRIYVFLTQIIVTKLLEIRSDLFIERSRVRIYFHPWSRIPDPRAKKAPDPGSRIRIHNTDLNTCNYSKASSAMYLFDKYVLYCTLWFLLFQTPQGKADPELANNNCELVILVLLVSVSVGLSS